MTDNIQPRRFPGQVAVITGAARGIGRACAQRFAREGADVACLDLLAGENEAAAAACRDLGVEALALTCNVTEPESVRAAVGETLDRWGRIDVLITAAGIYSGSPLAEVSLDQWQRLIDVNLTGVFLCNQAVAPAMIEQGSGSIVNISSMAGKTSWPSTAEYSASKTGVIGLTRSVAMELAPHGPTANAVCPGNTLTDMVRGVAARQGELLGMTGEEWLQMRANDCPMNRLAEPWEIAGVCAFLASEDARYITGQAIEVDGGLVMS
ncbi:MAG: SDR family NAD(P)-dependent oxidoreductase [Anaerolineae bacterium]|jgi:NAD(P)-dependent dehydrogenase (short-subunit alcohol dehydrogenase family)